MQSLISFTKFVLCLPLILVCASCGSQNKIEDTPSAFFTEFISQDFIRQHKIKNVDMVITRETYNPFEYDKETYSSIPGILTSYSFRPDGILESEGNGISSVRARYHYDENNEIIGQDFSFGDEYRNYSLADVRLKNRMKWVSKGNLKKQMQLHVSSACYEVNADYLFELSDTQTLPMFGKGEFLKASGERYSDQYPETLDIYFRYEFYE